MPSSLAPSQPRFLVASEPHLERAITEYMLQTAVMQAQEEKSFYGARLIVELYRQGKLSVEEAMDLMMSVDPTTEFGEPFDQMRRQFNIDLMTNMFDSVMKVLQIGSRNIAIEIARSLYLPPLPPRQPGLFARILAAILGEEER